MTASGEYKGLENEFSQTTTMQKGEENMKMGKSSLETRPKIWGLLGETRQVTLFLNFADEFKFHDTHITRQKSA